MSTDAAGVGGSVIRAAGAPARRRGRGRPPGATSDLTRERIVDAAADLIGEAGFAALTMAQVAARAGLSPSGTAHHFGSKEDLLAAVLVRRDEQSRAIVGPPGGTIWEVYAGLLRLVEHNAGHREVVRLFVSVSAEAVDARHPGHAWMRQHYAATRAQLTEAFRRGVCDGLIAADAPIPDLVVRTIAVLDGLQIQWLLRPEETDMAAAFEAFVLDIRARWSHQAG